MDQEKRIAGDYTIIAGLRVGDREVVIGENPNAPKGEKFMCGLGQRTDLFVLYEDCMVSDDYLEIAELFGKRINGQVEKTREEFARLVQPGFDDTPLTKDDCDPISYADCILDKVIVIKAEVLRPEYQRATRQLKLCRGGFGASGNSRGSACFCTDLITGKESRFERRDVLGTISPDKLPQWAKDGLEKVLATEREKKAASKEAR